MTDPTNAIETTFHADCFTNKSPVLALETAYKLQNLKCGHGGAGTSNESGEWAAVINLSTGFVLLTDMCAVLVIGSTVRPIDEALALSIINEEQSLVRGAKILDSLLSEHKRIKGEVQLGNIDFPNTDFQERPVEDFDLEEDQVSIEMILKSCTSMARRGWTDNEIFSLLINQEEVNPILTEDVALRRMDKIEKRVKARLKKEREAHAD